MTRVEQRLLLLTGFVLLAGSGLYVALGGLSRPDDQPVRPTPGAGATAPADPSSAPRPIGSAPSTLPGNGAEGTELGSSSAGVRPGLREPSGDDLTDPKQVKALLRAHLAEENVRWDYVAKLLGF